MPKLEVEQKKNIFFLLNKLIKVRNENPAEYSLPLWVDTFEERGFTYEQISEMINLAYELPRYNLLAIGDLIDNWKKVTEEDMPLNWKDFNKMLKKLLESDLTLLNKISNMILGIDFLLLPEREQIRQIVNDYQKKLEDDKINKDWEAEINYINKCNSDKELFEKEINMRIKDLLTELIKDSPELLSLLEKKLKKKFLELNK